MDTRIISCYSVYTMRSTILKQEPNLASLHAEDSQYNMSFDTISLCEETVDEMQKSKLLWLAYYAGF